MSRAVPIYPTTLDGIPTGGGPYILGIDVEVMDHWGEALTYQAAKKLHLPTGVKSLPGCGITYSKASPRKQRSVVRATSKRPVRNLKASTKKRKRRS